MDFVSDSPMKTSLNQCEKSERGKIFVNEDNEI